jgi:hypothetical protein
MGDCPYTCQSQDPHGERDLAGDGDWRNFSAATKLLETKWIDIVVVFTGGVSVVPILLPAISRHQPATTAQRAEERACETSQARFYLLIRRPGARLFEEANQRSSTSRDARGHQHQHL